MISTNKYSTRSHLIGGGAYIVGAVNTSLFKATNNWVLLVLFQLGLILMLYCFYILYIKKDARTNLITNSVFKYTRHPMYTGASLVYLLFFNPENYSLIFWILTVLHYLCLIIGGYFQEKETVERFGQEAITYYNKTPRLFFSYPFIKK